MMMVSHGVSSSGLFAVANVRYIMTGSRQLASFKGRFNYAPEVGGLWFLLLLANIAGPPSLNLVREVLIMTRVLRVSRHLAFVVFASIVMGASYNLYLFASHVGGGQTNISNISSLDLLQGRLHVVPMLILFSTIS